MTVTKCPCCHQPAIHNEWQPPDCKNCAINRDLRTELVKAIAEGNGYFAEMVDRGDKIDAQADLLRRCEKVLQYVLSPDFYTKNRSRRDVPVEALLNDLEAYKEVEGG